MSLNSASLKEHFWKREDILGYIGNPRKPSVYQKPPCQIPLKEVFKLYNKWEQLYLMSMN